MGSSYDGIDPYGDVAAFHEHVGSPVEKKLDDDALYDRMFQRLLWLKEEVAELEGAIESGDRVAMLDASLDIAYYVVGNAVENGWDFGEGWARVQAANMTKEPGSCEAGGKALKGGDYCAPNLEDLV